MRLKSKRVQQASLVALVIGAAVIVATLLSMWLGGSDDDKALSGDGFGGSQGLGPRDTGLSESTQTEATTDPGISAALKTGGVDPFASKSGDHTLHKVVIRFTSDGGMYAGWRYRSKGGEGVKIANRTLEVSRTVRGPLPVAQAAVRVLQTSTYATCTIFVDGVAVTTQTAKGVNYITVCFG